MEQLMPSPEACVSGTEEAFFPAAAEISDREGPGSRRGLNPGWYLGFVSRLAVSRLNWRVLLVGGCALYFLAQLVRAAIRFEHWAWIVR